jgi:hypothetical protein
LPPAPIDDRHHHERPRLSGHFVKRVRNGDRLERYTEPSARHTTVRQERWDHAVDRRGRDDQHLTVRPER